MNFSACCHVPGSPALFGFALCQLAGHKEIGSQRAIAWKHLLLSILVSSTSSFPPASVALLFCSLHTGSGRRFIFKSSFVGPFLSPLISCKDSMEMNIGFVIEVYCSDVLCFCTFLQGLEILVVSTGCWWRLN